MKKLIANLILCFSFAFSTVGLTAQQYSLVELTVIKPAQVIIENYTVVVLTKDIIEDPMANHFDSNNPYTYLQIVNDEKANRYHILVQTNFFGKVLFLAYSNNLSGLFNKENKPMFLFTHCIKEINRHVFATQVIDAVLKCMVGRLNYCSDQ